MAIIDKQKQNSSPEPGEEFSLSKIELEFLLLLIEAFFVGFIWFFLTLNVRKRWNPNASGEKLKKVIGKKLFFTI